MPQWRCKYKHEGSLNIREAYEESLSRAGHVDDPAQRDVIARFEDLQARLLAQGPRKGRLRSMFFRDEPRETVRGLYVWGGVGRGKTFLMDLFYESLEFDDVIAGTKVNMGPDDHVAADEVFISVIEGGSWKTLATLN